jgi:hypothetical protein
MWIRKFTHSILILLVIPHLLFSQSFVSANLMGQFGNQLFIMAAAISLALDNGAIYTFPDLVSNRTDPVYQIALNYKKIFYHINAFEPTKPYEFLYREQKFSYTPIPYHPNMHMIGWFQSEKYFINHKQEIIDLFSPHQELLDDLNAKYPDIINHQKTVSIHLRSYEKELPEVRRVYANIGAIYVERAISLFPDDSLFIVFSNDMEWCKRELSQISRPLLFIEGESFHHDFYLMSLCKHNIICNSTFSWWAAYLNRNPNKIIIAPSAWFQDFYIQDTQDLIPEDWIILPSSSA